MVDRKQQKHSRGAHTPVVVTTPNSKVILSRGFQLFNDRGRRVRQISALPPFTICCSSFQFVVAHIHSSLKQERISRAVITGEMGARAEHVGSGVVSGLAACVLDSMMSTQYSETVRRHYMR